MQVMLRTLQNTNSRTSNNILGINIDSERILTVYGTISGLVQERLVRPSNNQISFDSLLDMVTLQADKLLTLTQAQRLPVPDRVSIAISGNYDNETGIIESSSDFPHWKMEAVKSKLAMRFNLPVFMEQKANAAALAENLFGAGQGVRNLVYLGFSPSLRVGILTDGHVYRNPGGTCGNLGAMPVNFSEPDGSQLTLKLNQLLSSQGLRQLALRRHPLHWDDTLTIYQLIQDALNGDPYAEEIFTEACGYLGNSLLPLTYLLRPEKIVLGYPLCQLGENFLPALRNSLQSIIGQTEMPLPDLVCSPLCSRLAELETLAPAINAARPI